MTQSSLATPAGGSSSAPGKSSGPGATLLMALALLTIGLALAPSARAELS